MCFVTRKLVFLTCDFFLWEFAKERVFVPPLPADLDKFKNRITAAMKCVTEDTPRHVWNEFSYCCCQCSKWRAHRPSVIMISET